MLGLSESPTTLEAKRQSMQDSYPDAEGHTVSREGLHADGPDKAPTSTRKCTASPRSEPRAPVA